MAHYVLLSFDDDESAERFVANVTRDNETYTLDADAWGGVSNDHRSHFVTVRGVWRKPTKFCEGAGCTSGGAKARPGFTRGRKYGWMVCANCKRPTRGWANGEHWHTSLGVNLLPISPDAPEYRGAGHVTHPGYQPRAIWCQQCGRFKFRLEPGGMCDEHPDVQLTLSPMHLEKMKASEGVEKNDE